MAGAACAASWAWPISWALPHARCGWSSRPCARCSTPAILHWDLNHFVVLAETSRRGIVVHDPGLGRRELTFEEASKHVTGVVLELMPSPPSRR